MKRFLTIVLVYCLGVLTGPVIFYGALFIQHALFMPYAGLAPGVTVKGIREIKVGMTEAQVRELIGAPFAAGPTGCPYNSETLLPNCHPDSFTYVYSKREDRRGYPILWVHFRHDQVSGVYAKYYSFFDDMGVYGRNSHICEPAAADREFGCTWERPEFVKYFPSKG